jgi:hypothetical protein
MFMFLDLFYFILFYFHLCVSEALDSDDRFSELPFVSKIPVVDHKMFSIKESEDETRDSIV